MTANGSNSSFNSTQSGLGATCSLLGTSSWQSEYLTPTTFLILVATVFVEGLMIPFIISLNALVIWVVWRKRRLRKQKSCVLLACLAATDLLVGVFSLPLAVVVHIMRLFGAGPICIMDRLGFEALYIACGASLFHLVIISGERYVAIKHALRYETLVTTKRVCGAVAAAWALALIFRTIALPAGDNTAFQDLVQHVTALVFFFVVLAVVSYCQVAMYLESRRHLKHIGTHQVSEDAAKEILKKDKAARTTAMIVGALCLCYFPSVVAMAVFTSMKDLRKNVVLTSLSATDAFIYSNSLINPILYCMRTRGLRKAVEEFFNREPSLPEVEPGLVEAARRRRPQNGSDVVTRASRLKKQVARSNKKLSRRRRARSLHLVKDSKHEPRTHRLRSV